LKHFVIVHTDTCVVDNTIYVVNTSVNALIYRIEVFKNEILIDKIEVNCMERQEQKNSNQSFVDRYQEAHKKMRTKYCQVLKDKPNNMKVHPETKRNAIKKSILLFFVAVVSIYFLLTNLYIYSDFYINIFYSEKDEKILYLEKIEIKTHKLGKRCILLSKNELNEQSIITAQNCKKWCDKRIIDKDKCDLFLAYFAIKTEEKVNIPTLNKQVTSYKVLPKEENVELSIFKSLQLKIYNESSHQILVTLKEISLDNNTNEEIVQFEQAVTYFTLGIKEEKIFYIFLEPSYYKQFNLGKYTGKLVFDVKYQNKIIDTIQKQFHFMVE